MRNVLAVALLLSLPIITSAKKPNKYDPALFSQMGTVTAFGTERVYAGSSTHSPSGCENPQTPFMQGYCATASSHTTDDYVYVRHVSMQIGGTLYTLSSKRGLLPGTYHVRFNKSRIEVLCHDGRSGKPMIMALWIVGASAAHAADGGGK